MRLGGYKSVLGAVAALAFLLTCINQNPSGPDDRKPQILAMPDTSVSINDSFFVHVSLNTIGSTGVKFIWNLGAGGITDTVGENALKVAFKDTGKVAVIVSAVNRKGIYRSRIRFRSWFLPSRR